MTAAQSPNRRVFVDRDGPRCASFIDTISLRMPMKMPAEVFAGVVMNLRRSAGTRGNAPPYYTQRVELPNGKWMFVLHLHQPTFEAMNILNEARLSFSIIGVHVAVDLEAASTESAVACRDLVLERMVAGLRRAEPVRWEYEDGAERTATAYLEHSRRRGIKFAIYADRPSKVPGFGDCLHVECRLMGQAILRNLGLSTLDGIVMLDHQAFWNNRLALYRPLSVERVETLLARAGKDAGRDLVDAYWQGLVDVGSGLPNRVPQSNVWHVLRSMPEVRSCRPSRWMVREDHGWMLPDSPQNALWR